MHISDQPEVEVYQDQRELDFLLERYTSLRARSVLEIGSLLGGTLWHWMKYAESRAQVVSIDLLVPHGDPRYRQQKAGHDVVWPAWAEQFGQSLTVIERDSRDTVQEVSRFAPFDFVFIDGDHRYEVAKADFDNYAPMVGPGGIVALHDIDISEAHPEYYGVRPLWQEIKQSYRTEEIIEQPGWLGIGIVYV